MASTRLNEGHRGALRALAIRVVDCPEETKAEDRAYKRAAPLVAKVVLKQYPEAEMKVLSKYDLTRRDACINLQLTAGGVEQFKFRDGEEAVVANTEYSCRHRIYSTDERTTEAVTAWRQCFDAKEAAIKRKLADYTAFIASATTFEQVLEIWPEAEEIAPRIRKNLPVALSEETVAAITADSNRRMKSEHRKAT